MEAETMVKEKKLNKKQQTHGNLELHYEHLEQRIRNVEKWWPKYHLEHPDADSENVIMKMREEMGEIGKEMKNFDIEDMKDVPMRDFEIPPELDGTPSWKQFEKAAVIMEYIDRIKRGPVNEQMGPGTSTPLPQTDDTEPTSIHGYKRPSSYDGVFDQDIDYGDEDHDRFISKYNYDETSQQINFRQDIKVVDYGEIYRIASLCYDFGEAPFDAILVWNTNVHLDIPYALNADSAAFYGSIDVIENPEEQLDSNSVWYGTSASGFHKLAINGRKKGHFSETYEIGSNFIVKKGKPVKIHIGIALRNVVWDDGRAGTKRDWGFMRILGYFAIPGLMEYRFVRV